ncbi:hypothetical protein AAFH68_16240 [Flavobacterium sp. CGRL1]
MKNIRKNIERWLEGLDRGWEQLPIEKQHHYILCFFTVYLLLTAWIIFRIWYDTARFQNTAVIEHIENQGLNKKENAAELQDKGSPMLKNKIYERK